MNNPVNLTKAASDKITEIMSKENLVGRNLRIGVRGGGCVGFEYLLDFDDKVNDNDFVYNSENITIVVDDISANYLVGTTIDYLNDLNNNGFKFINPNAIKHCGCEKSFSV